MNAPFKSNLVIEEKINNSSLKAYLVGYDINDYGISEYRVDPLVKIIMSAIHEFAYGYHEGMNTDNTESLDKIIDAANSIYKIDSFQKVKDLYENSGHIDDDLADKFLRRGEFGELILHLLLRDFHNTIPLVSKIYFKDSVGHAVHGFDSVHIQPESKTLWLGESKLYIDPFRGVSELIADLDSHFKTDYLNSEFAIISKKITDTNFYNVEYWQSLLSSATKLKEKLTSINIPLLCTFSCELFEHYDDEYNEEFTAKYSDKIEEIRKHFIKNFKHPLRENLNVILLLFPVRCKKELVKKLHRKLSLIQELGK